MVIFLRCLLNCAVKCPSIIGLVRPDPIFKQYVENGIYSKIECLSLPKKSDRDNIPHLTMHLMVSFPLLTMLKQLFLPLPRLNQTTYSCKKKHNYKPIKSCKD